MNKINYDKHDWIDGEPITEALFNNIESGIGRTTSYTNLLVDRTNQEEEGLSTTEGKIEHQDMEFDIAIGEHDTLDERLKADVSRFVEVWSGGNYMPFEGKNIRIDNSKVGWIRDFCVKGNTYQDPNNLSDIQSAGELVDGRYEIEILSNNKNLLDRNYLIEGGLTITVGNTFEQNKIVIDGKNRFRYDKLIRVYGDYTFSFNHDKCIAGVHRYTLDEKFVSESTFKYTDIHDNWDGYITVGGRKLDNTQITESDLDSFNVMIEEKASSSEFEEYKQNKTQILLDEPLMKLPDGVCDTIEQREDGVYLVKRTEKVSYTTGDENLENCITDKTISYKAKATPIETKLDIDMSKWLTYQGVTYFTTTCNVQPTLSLKAPVDVNKVVSELQTANYSLRRNNQQLEQENQQAEKELDILQEQCDQQTADLLDMDMRVLILEE